MPDAKKIRRLRIASRGSTEKREGGAIVVPGNDLGEFRVLDSERCTCVLGLRPAHATVMRDSDLCVPIAVHVAEIDGVIGTRGNRRIAARTYGFSIGHR